MLTKSSKDADYGGDYEGTVTIDLKNRQAVVELKRESAKPGEASRVVAFPYNGKFKVTKGLDYIGKKKIRTSKPKP